MVVRAPLLALVLLAVCGGSATSWASPGWPAGPVDPSPIEAPAAPDAPAEADETETEEEAVRDVAVPSVAGRAVAVPPSRLRAPAADLAEPAPPPER